MGGLGGHYAKWNKSNIIISLVHGSRKQIKKQKQITDTDQVDKKQLVKMTKRYKIPVIRSVSPGELM